ncbi:hypothetical protein OK016_23335 [Vibrio chagasii]|nr:hypothetical protein [Vibrio chagasii]
MFAPLILNTVELVPGEAGHAPVRRNPTCLQVQGTGLEIAANSDNVLRRPRQPNIRRRLGAIDNTIFEPIGLAKIFVLSLH